MELEKTYYAAIGNAKGEGIAAISYSEEMS